MRTSLLSRLNKYYYGGGESNINNCLIQGSTVFSKNMIARVDPQQQTTGTRNFEYTELRRYAWPI